MKKILILHTSIGLGHKSIAENIGYYLAQEGYEVRLEDIGKVQEGRFARVTIAIHQFINKYIPSVWAFLYRWGHYPVLPFRVFIAGFNYRQTEKLVLEFGPDLIITVQTTASAVISFLKKQGSYKGPFGIAFSDYHLHRYWLYGQADFYLANTQEQKIEMARLGIDGKKVFVCGMTVKPKVQVDALSVKNRLGLGLSQKIVLVGAGSLGIGFPEEIFKKLSQDTDAAVVVVCGKNAAMQENLQKYCSPRFKVLGFYRPMSELYAITDVFVTKPGGLTVAEALQWGLPMVVTHWLPGQEELNCRYLSERNLIILKPADLIGTIKQELTTGAFRKSLSANPHVSEVVSGGRPAVSAVNQGFGQLREAAKVVARELTKS